MKKKVVIYGIGQASDKYLKNIEEEWEVVTVCDGYNIYSLQWHICLFVSHTGCLYETDYLIRAHKFVVGRFREGNSRAAHKRSRHKSSLGDDIAQ